MVFENTNIGLYFIETILYGIFFFSYEYYSFSKFFYSINVKYVLIAVSLEYFPVRSTRLATRGVNLIRP
jgi:hypothetical protein